ncbi:hypothetical protein BLJAPNOD_01276 [Ensifer sp. M14]|uniref:hypothetical protein n=1 Tax=Ensifer sp. M14 TaxID=2203782 RepID=UPI000E1CD77B|nr:hypothetical protein [Ensifer sp. M14]RDL50158.1 hypothetical protein BLJAPNOD_01276 [Ensifer sp. M14]
MFSNFQDFTQKRRHIKFADPDIGGGKTYGLEQFVAHPFTGKSLIGIQSINLAKEIEAHLKAENVSVLRIDTDAFPFDPEKPEVTCTTILNDAIASGEYQVLISNQDVALRADGANVGDYGLFMDEIQPVHERIWLNGIVTSQGAVASYLTSLPVGGVKGVRRIIVTDEGERFLATNHIEEQAKAKSELVDAVRKAKATDFYDVFAEEGVWSDFRSGLEPSLVLHSIMKPAVYDKFASVTVLGANFNFSLMSLIWGGFHAVEFELHSQIMNAVRYEKLSEHMANQVLVYYHTEKNCSKTTYNQIDYQPTFDVSHDAVKRLFAEHGYPEDTKHLVFMNNKPKGVKNDFYWKDADNGILLSPVARGWDSFKEVDVAIHLAACNEHGDTYRVLSALFKLTKAEIDRATALERAYQAVGRSSIRDMHRGERTKRPAILVFFDYRAARFVADIAACGEPIFLDTGLAALAPKEKKTQSDYQKKSNHKNAVKAVAKLPNYDGFNRRKWMDLWSADLWDEVKASWVDWVADSKEFALHDRPPRKEQSTMYREGVFKSASNHKVKGNIEATKVITLDFDEVTGDVQAFSEWLKARGKSHLITNSFSSTAEAPRFRLDIPLSQPVNAYGYSHIVAHLIQEIADEFGSAFIVDKSKKTIMARFHMPSVSIHGADLFIDGTVKTGVETAFLNVMTYMDRDPVEDGKSVVDTVAKPVVARIGTMSVDEVLDKWAVAAGLGMGSQNFHQAAVDLLFKVKLTREETIETLHLNRYRFGNGDDRDAQYTVDFILDNRRDHAA